MKYRIGQFAKHFVLLICPVLLLAGCQSTGIVREQQIEDLRQEVERQPTDAKAVGRLADAYGKRYGETFSPYYRDLAIENYKKFLLLNPGHPGASLALYQIMLREVLRRGFMSYLPEMRKLYSEVAIIPEAGMLPPSTAQALITYASEKGIPNGRRIHELLNQGVRENPANLTTRLMMARLYLERKHYDMALAVIRQARSMVKEEQLKQLQPLFAEILYEMSDSYKCVTRNAYVDEALREVKSAYALDTSDTEMEYRLAKLYAVKELYPMSIFTMRDLLGKDDATWNRFQLAQYLWRSGDDDAAADLFTEYLDDSQYSSDARELMGRLRLGQGEWDQSADYFRQYLKDVKRPDVYPALLLYLADAQAGRLDDAREELSGFLPTNIRNYWETALYDYYMDRRTAEEVVEVAGDLCQEVEAHYYVGMKELVTGRNGRAMQELNKVIELNLPQYHEHHLAKRSLQRLKLE